MPASILHTLAVSSSLALDLSPGDGDNSSPSCPSPSGYVAWTGFLFSKVLMTPAYFPGGGRQIAFHAYCSLGQSSASVTQGSRAHVGCVCTHTSLQAALSCPKPCCLGNKNWAKGEIQNIIKMGRTFCSHTTTNKIPPCQHLPFKCFYHLKRQ